MKIVTSHWSHHCEFSNEQEHEMFFHLVAPRTICRSKCICSRCNLFHCQLSCRVPSLDWLFMTLASGGFYGSDTATPQRGRLWPRAAANAAQSDCLPLDPWRLSWVFLT